MAPHLAAIFFVFEPYSASPFMFRSRYHAETKFVHELQLWHIRNEIEIEVEVKVVAIS